MSKTYRLTYDQAVQISRLCRQEQGTVAGSAAEASLMANLLETTPAYQQKYGDDIYSFVRYSGWFSRAAYWMDHGSTTEAITAAVRDVLINGNRTLPPYVNEHDCFSDISSATSCGSAINKNQRGAYQRDVTKIRNRYGSTYTFYCFPDENSDPFGYTSKPQPTEPLTAKKVVDLVQHYKGYEEKASAMWLDDFHRNAGKSNYQRFQPMAGAGNGSEWCQYTVDAIFVELAGSIRKARYYLCMPQNDGQMTGFTPDGAEFFQKAGRWYLMPEVGDVVYFWSDAKDRIGHTGIVVAVDKSRKTFTSCEGNTSGGSYSENGGTIASHEYSYANAGKKKERVQGFGRPRYDKNEGGWTVLDNRTFVGNVYMDELYRAPSAAEVDKWVQQIEAGKSYDGVIAGVRNSEEGMRAWISRCYWMLLEREPDQDGLEAWLTAMKAGKTRAGVVEGFKNSQEYKDLHKND